MMMMMMRQQLFFSAAAVDSRLRLHCLTFGCTNIALCSQLEMRAADPQQLAMTPRLRT
jgi:hypothetical protein